MGWQMGWTVLSQLPPIAPMIRKCATDCARSYGNQKRPAGRAYASLFLTEVVSRS
jgi:hypothetical protein